MSDTDDEMLRLIVEPAAPPATGERLDRWLARHPDILDHPSALSRSRLKALIMEGKVTADAVTLTDPSAPVKPGQVICVTLPPPVDTTTLPEDLPLDIIHDDDDLLVINKAAGMAVHPATGTLSGTVVNALLFHVGTQLSGIGGVRRPGIVHRLDKDTSGLLVVAKNDRAHHGLAAQFHDHSIHREYHALVWGVPHPPADRIVGDIGRDPRQRTRMAVVTRGGKPAITDYRRLTAFGQGAALIACRLETGRTHQIRVHMASRGHPLIGDSVYGKATRQRRQRLADWSTTAVDPATSFPRQALHAATLGFRHPIDGRELLFERPPPADFAHLASMLSRN